MLQWLNLESTNHNAAGSSEMRKPIGLSVKCPKKYTVTFQVMIIRPVVRIMLFVIRPTNVANNQIKSGLFQATWPIKVKN